MIAISHSYEKGNHVPQSNEKAQYWMKRAATAGTLDAVYALGEYYEKGRAGLVKDLKKAIELYERAAMSRNAGGWTSFSPAVDKLAALHMGRGGAQRNPTEALKWLHRSRKSSAKFDLGCLYRDGDGVEKNSTLAFEQFLKAAKKNHQRAIAEVIKAYGTGNGVPKDQKEADQWREKLRK